MSLTIPMRIDLHTHVVPARWDDRAARLGGGKWRLDPKDVCHGPAAIPRAPREYYPFDMGVDDPVGLLAGAGLDATVRSGIEHASAVRFLGLA